MTKKIKKSPEEITGELLEIARNLRTNGQKVNLVVDCEEHESCKINPLLKKLRNLYGAGNLSIVLVKNQWRLMDDDSKHTTGR